MAYVLVNSYVGKSFDVLCRLKALPEVRLVDRVMGPCDVIARVEVADLEALGGLLKKTVHTLPGVAKTVTCVVVESQPGPTEQPTEGFAG